MKTRNFIVKHLIHLGLHPDSRMYRWYIVGGDKMETIDEGIVNCFVFQGKYYFSDTELFLQVLVKKKNKLVLLEPVIFFLEDENGIPINDYQFPLEFFQIEKAFVEFLKDSIDKVKEEN